MKIINRLIILLLVTYVMFTGSFLVLYVAGYIQLEQIHFLLYAMIADETLGYIVGGIGVGLLLINFLFYRSFSVNVHRDKVIAFDNPSGRVTVSLFAIQDMVKRKIFSVPEVRDVKTTMRATRKGLQIRIKLQLRSEVNIPEITSKMQGLVTKKIQDTIGVDEPVDVAIYIGKIMPEKGRSRVVEKEVPESKDDPTVPFHGYRA